MQTELLQAEAALSRRERKVRHDCNGKLPPWWPH